MKTLRATIDRRIAAGELTADPAQDGAIAALDHLLSDLAKPRVANKGSALGWLFGKGRDKGETDSVRGLYLFGGVGRGKTMLMDTAFALAEGLPRATPRRRAHFHAFMADVHARIHAFRQDESTNGDPIGPVADDLAAQAQLLAFDEFAVTDAADAMILARLFTALFERGVTVIATSNVAPNDLYRDGLNRSFFVPFIRLMEQRMVVLELASSTDHRMNRLAQGTRYLTGTGAEDAFEAVWDDMVGHVAEETVILTVAGRALRFDRVARRQVRTTFDHLCRTALGASDYLAIVKRFDTVCLQGVPVMGPEDRNAVKRFIALVDTLYDAGRVLIVEAEAMPEALYTATSGTEAFEFRRTVSRLREMDSAEWGR